MDKASVSIQAINAGQQVCQMTIESFQETIETLSKEYENARQDWDDEKFARLGDIVDECNNSLKKAVQKLGKSLETLEQIANTIGEYEEVDL